MLNHFPYEHTVLVPEEAEDDTEAEVDVSGSGREVDGGVYIVARGTSASWPRKTIPALSDNRGETLVGQGVDWSMFILPSSFADDVGRAFPLLKAGRPRRVFRKFSY